MSFEINGTYYNNDLESIYKELMYDKIIKSPSLLTKINIKYITQDLCNTLITNDIKNIEYIPEKFQSEDLCKNIVKTDGLLLRYIKKKTVNICIIAINNNINAFQYLSGDDILLWQVCKNLYGDSINTIEDIYNIIRCKKYDKLTAIKDGSVKMTTIEEVKDRIRQNWNYLDAVFQSDDICMFAIDINGNAIKHIINQKEELCIMAVKKTGLALRYILKKTHEICKIAVTEDYRALQYVDEEMQTDEIIKIALKQDLTAIKYVKNNVKIAEEMVKISYKLLDFITKQTDTMVQNALEQNPEAIQYVIDQKEKYCIKAVTASWTNLQYIKREYQTLSVCKTAIFENVEALKHVKDQNLEIIDYALTLSDEAKKYINVFDL